MVTFKSFFQKTITTYLELKIFRHSLEGAPAQRATQHVGGEVSDVELVSLPHLVTVSDKFVALIIIIIIYCEHGLFINMPTKLLIYTSNLTLWSLLIIEWYVSFINNIISAERLYTVGHRLIPKLSLIDGSVLPPSNNVSWVSSGRRTTFWGLTTLHLLKHTQSMTLQSLRILRATQLSINSFDHL